MIIKHLFLFIYILNSTWAFCQSPTEQAILKLSKEKFQYCNADDTDKLKKYLDDRIVFIHSNGLTETKGEMIENLKNGMWKINAVDIHEASVRVYKNNFAIVLGKGLFHAMSSGKNIDVELYYSEVWTHVKKGWLLANRQAIKLQ